MYAFTPNSITVSPPGVLLNDRADPSCPASELRVHMTSGPEYGTVTLREDGGFEYTVGVELQGSRG